MRNLVDDLAIESIIEIVIRSADIQNPVSRQASWLVHLKIKNYVKHDEGSNS